MSVNRAAIVVDGRIFERSDTDNSGVIDQHIDWAEISLNGFNCEFRFLADCHVCFERQNIVTQTAQQRLGFLQGCCITRTNRDPSTMFDKFLGQQEP